MSNFDDDDFMSAGGGKTVPFDNIGDTVTGLVLSKPERRVQMDEDGEPKTFKDGTVRQMYVITIQTELRDPSDPYDDGVRTLYVKWKSHEAVKNAVKASGAAGLKPGGLLTLTLSGFGPKTSPKYSPPKYWTASYIPPDDSAAFMGEPAAPAQPVNHWAAPETPQARQAAAPPPPAAVDHAELTRRLQAQQAAAVARMKATGQDQEPPF